MNRFKLDKIFIIFLLTFCAFSVQRAVGQDLTGHIQSESGSPISGARLQLIENPNIKSQTNKNGLFKISAEKGDEAIVIQENGQRKVISLPSSGQIVTLQDRKSNGIKLGFGIARQAGEMTEAVGSTIVGQAGQSSSVINPGNILYGRLAGLTVLQNGGSPPTSPTFYIRGRETINNSEPLVLVDGFEQPLDALNVREIESINILKDAASLAMYGQRGANGVILVTTKRGQDKELRVNASIEQGFTEPVGMPNFVDASTYARAINEALTNDNLNTKYSRSDINGFGETGSSYLYPNVDWQDRVLRDHGSRSNFNLTFQGGGEKAKYFAMVNYARDSGLYEPIESSGDYDTQLKHGKFNFRSNLDIKLTETLFLQLNAAGNLIENNVPSGSGSDSEIFNALYSIPSAAFPVKTQNGNWGGTQLYGNNPVAILSSTGYGSPNQREFNLDASLKKDLDIWEEGLSAEIRVRYDNFNSYDESQLKDFRYEEINPVRNNNGEIVDTTTTLYGQNNDLSFNSGFDQQRSQYNALGKVDYERGFGNNKIDATVLFHQDIRVLDGQDNTYHRQNFAANIHYGISNKYFIGLSGSYSGDNLLPDGKRFGFFPAVSAAWLASQEDFLSDVSSINLLKIRASWGLSGSDALPTNNPYEQSYNYAQGYYWQDGNNFQGGYREGQLATTDFTYEKSQKLNFGIDAGFFNKLNFTADAYFARRTNILTTSNGRYSGVLGINPPLATNGEVENKGIETTVTWQNHVGGLGYNLGGTFSYNHNEIIEMNEEYRPYDYMKRTGQQIGQQFGLEAIGFFKDQEDIENSPSQTYGEVQPGDIKYRDQNGDGIINEFDEVALGDATGYPEITYSFNIGLEYHGIGITALVQGTHNYSAYLNTQSVFWPLRNNTTVSTYYYNHRWTPETASSAQYPRLTTKNSNNNYRANSLWIKDRSYLKLRNVELSYVLPTSIIGGWNLRRFRIYLSGRNLFSIDNIPVLDPEQLSVGYPLLKSYQAGLEIEF